MPHNGKCKARHDQTCNHYEKMGHFASVCERRTKYQKPTNNEKVNIQHLKVLPILDKVYATPSFSKYIRAPLSKFVGIVSLEL